jgi:hypothetical protein
LTIAADADHRWPSYAAYCRERERGLRSAALNRLTEFIHQTSTAALQERIEFVDWLCHRLIEHEMAGAALTPQPLMEQILLPTLDEWKNTFPNEAAPYRWLGVLTSAAYYNGMRAGLSQPETSSIEFLKTALEIDPADQIALLRYIECRIGLLDFLAHHLPEHYLGEPEADIEITNECQQLCRGIHIPSEQERLLDELSAARQLIIDWEEAKSSGEDFRTWCQRHNRNYAWTITRVYVR